MNDFLKRRLASEYEATQRNLKSSLRDHLHRVAAALDDLDDGERLDANLFGNAGIMSGTRVAERWNKGDL